MSVLVAGRIKAPLPTGRCPPCILVAGTCEYIPSCGKMNFPDVIENVEVEKLHWVILKAGRGGQIGLFWVIGEMQHCWLWGREPWAKKYEWTLEGRKGRKTDLANTLILAQRYQCRTSDVQNCKMIKVHCFKPLNLS